MKLSELGERKIIELITRDMTCPEALVGIGDDAAVYPMGERYLVVSTDMACQGTHFPQEMTHYQMGKYAVNVNLSDIASMGAQSLGMVLAMGLPRDMESEVASELAKGIKDACDDHGVCILGGDTKENEKIIITGTAFGEVAKERILTRSGAGTGDLICVTGKIGSAAAGFYCLTKGLDLGHEIKERFIKRALEPQARVKEGPILGRHATSCIDISDGLAYSLHEIAHQSKVGFVVHEDKVPIDRDLAAVAEASGVSQREMVFHKGGDFELLFTLREEDVEALRDEMDLVVIGRVTKDGGKMVTRDGKEEDLPARGYEAFGTNY